MFIAASLLTSCVVVREKDGVPGKPGSPGSSDGSNNSGK